MGIPQQALRVECRVSDSVRHFFQDLPPEEFHKLTTTKWKESMLECITNDGGYSEKEIVDCDDDDDEE